MPLDSFHLTHPFVLWGLLIIPVVWSAFFLLHYYSPSLHYLERFIDKHLLPHLVVNTKEKKRSLAKTLLFWSIVWSCLTLGLAGPRWNFQEVETFSKDQSLIILLDLSESMNATDLKPSRLIRAKQKIEDLLSEAQGVKIGLIAFAADPHMIAPLTDDKETLRHLLPSLTTDLVYVQGSRLSSALTMAATMFSREPGQNKALLIISDGGFEDSSALITAKKLAQQGITIHTMGVGTVEGAILSQQGKEGEKKRPTLSRLEKEKLEEVSHIGNGHYLETHYVDKAEFIVLEELNKRAEAQMNLGKKHLFWEEHFYLFLLPTIPLFLWWFRRGYVVALLAISLLPTLAYADWFKNQEECGYEAFMEEHYEEAASLFEDPYKKGVALYRAGKYAEAEKAFRASNREEVAMSAAYNLGNALAYQEKIEEAIAAYEDLLKKWPDHTRAKENRDLLKQRQEESQQNNQENQDNKNDQDNKEQSEQQNNDSQDNNEERQNEEKSQEEEKGKQNQKEDEQKNEPTKPQPQPQAKSEAELDADAWLNQIVNDPKEFLKNKFYIESKRSGTKEGVSPW